MLKTELASTLPSRPVGGPAIPGPDPSLMPPAAVPEYRTPAKAMTHRPAAQTAALRRLHYHLDLLEAGYRQALRPDLQAPSQRAERIALGIDRPELDAIPLWSVRRADGAVAIPFIEFVLGEIHRGLEPVARAATAVDRRAAVRLAEGRRLVGRILQAIDADRRHRTVPRLGDLYLPGDLVERICGPDGLLRRLRRDCAGPFGEEDAAWRH